MLRHPIGDFLKVADGGRQTDELDVGRCLDDDLFPDRAARKVIDVVNLVEDDIADPLKALRVLVNQVAQNFRGHDHDRRQRIDRVFTGHETHVPLAMPAAVIAELLIGKRLQGGGVDGPRVRLEGAQDGVVGDYRFA